MTEYRVAAEVYSVWLMPEPVWQRTFTAAVRDLAARFGAPVFEPHLTLIGGRPFDRADLDRRVAQALPGTAPIAQPIRDVVTGEAYFRSFFALFAAEGPLLELKHRVDRAVLGAAARDFMPHVSLLYGAAEPKAKAVAAADYRAAMTGLTVRFERVEIVRSGDEVPIEQWQSVAAFPFRRQGNDDRRHEKIIDTAPKRRRIPDMRLAGRGR
jgi:2'-5' RNA ligase